MQNRTLLTILACLCALLIFETGYLVGIGEQRRLYRSVVNRYIHPQRNLYSDWNMPPMPREKGPIQTREKSFFVAAMTSKETDQAKIITVNLPGVDKKDISIEINGRYLTIQAGRQKKAGIGNDNFYAETTSSSDFVQTITLDDNAKTHKIRAEFNKDTLTITVPKDKRFRKLPEKAFTIPVK